MIKKVFFLFKVLKLTKDLPFLNDVHDSFKSK